MSRFLCAVSFGIGLLACSDPPSDPSSDGSSAGFVWANAGSCSPNAPAVSLPTARHDSLPPLVRLPAYTDDEWQRIAEHVPGGWAGAYLEPVAGVNRLWLNFVDTTHLSMSLDSLAAYWTGKPVSFDRDDVLIRVVRWNWVQLNDWYRYVTVVVGLPDGWTYSDIDERENRLAFGAATPADRNVLLQRLRQLGAPCWLAAVEVRGYGVPKTARPPTTGVGIVAP
jgi:hypothetical protein